MSLVIVTALMRTLYFDINGTILGGDKAAVKRQLGDGQFEDAVRRAGFTRLVCVGNFGAIVHEIKELAPDYDEMGVLFRLCRGAFRDEAWLRATTVFAVDPSHRAAHIDFSGDWWYVDNLAQHYMQIAGKDEAFHTNLGHRICMPTPDGDGCDILQWLDTVVP